MKEVPMYSNIAAGSPIEMIDNIEGDFYLTKAGLKEEKKPLF